MKIDLKNLDESQCLALADRLQLAVRNREGKCLSAGKGMPQALAPNEGDVLAQVDYLATRCEALSALVGMANPAPAIIEAERHLAGVVQQAQSSAQAQPAGRKLTFTQRLMAERRPSSAAPLEPQYKSLPFSQRLAAEKAQHSAPVADPPPEASDRRLSFTERMKLCKGVAAVLLLSVATAFAGGPYGFSVCDGGTNNVASLSTNTVNSGYPAALDNYTNCFLVCSGVAQMSGASPTLGPATFCFSKGDGGLFETVPSVLLELPITTTNTTLAASASIHMGAAPKLKLVEVRHAGTNCYVTNLTVRWSTKPVGVLLLGK